MSEYYDLDRAELLSMLITTGDLVRKAKKVHHMTKPNSELDDGEIGKLMRWIGRATDSVFTSPSGSTIGERGIALMLFVALQEFPEFYQRRELAQFN